MSIALSKNELLTVVGGLSLAQAESIVFQGVEYDSREIRGGELFVALKGESSHGHQFVKQAFDRGASLFLIEDPSLAEDFPDPARLVVVKDSLEAFWTLASWWRKEVGLPVLAVTGSVGKTTVKELAAGILLRHSTGVYSLKSHNNHVGVPYTLCRISREHRWCITEVGTNHPGEIHQLSLLVAPNVAAVTCIATSHIEFFGSLAEIAREKIAIADGLRESGILVINGDDPVLEEAVSRFASDLPVRIERFGRQASAAQLIETSLRDIDGISLTLMLHGEKITVDCALLGRHNAQNVLAAILCCKCLLPEITVENIKQGLTAFKAPLMRLQLKPLPGERFVIDDSYNANPASMQSAIEFLRDLKGSGRKVGLVMGDMLELGQHSEPEHRKLAQMVGSLKPLFVVTVGSFTKCISDIAKAEGVQAFHANSPEEAGHIALKFDFDIVLVKASRGVALDRTVAIIEERS